MFKQINECEGLGPPFVYAKFYLLSLKAKQWCNTDVVINNRITESSSTFLVKGHVLPIKQNEVLKSREKVGST